MDELFLRYIISLAEMNRLLFNNIVALICILRIHVIECQCVMSLEKQKFLTQVTNIHAFVYMKLIKRGKQRLLFYIYLLIK